MTCMVGMLLVVVVFFVVEIHFFTLFISLSITLSNEALYGAASKLSIFSKMLSFAQLNMTSV